MFTSPLHAFLYLPCIQVYSYSAFKMKINLKNPEVDGQSHERGVKTMPRVSVGWGSNMWLQKQNYLSRKCPKEETALE